MRVGRRAAAVLQHADLYPLYVQPPLFSSVSHSFLVAAAGEALAFTCDDLLLPPSFLTLLFLKMSACVCPWGQLVSFRQTAAVRPVPFKRFSGTRRLLKGEDGGEVKLI